MKVLRAPEAKLRPDAWHLKLPIEKTILRCWEVLSPRKVRLAPGSRSVYFLTYTRGTRKHTLVTLYKADGGASEFGVVFKQRVHVDADSVDPVRAVLLVAVDELAERVTVVYQRARVVLLRHCSLRAADEHGAVFQTVHIPLPDVVSGAAFFYLSELVFFGEDDLLLIVLFKAPIGEDAALYQLTTHSPSRLSMQLLDSLVQAARLPFLSHFTYKGKCITGAEFFDDYPMLKNMLPVVLEPSILSAADVGGCTIFKGDTILWFGQPALEAVTGHRSFGPTLQLLGEWRGWLIVWSLVGHTLPVYAIRGWQLSNPHAVIVRKFDAWQSVPKWFFELRGLAGGLPMPTTTLSLRDGHLILQIQVGMSQHLIYLARINLDAWLPKAPLCFGCRITEPPAAPKHILACSVCKEKGFNSYGWLFGGRYCCKECQAADWKAHKQLHKFPPLDNWVNAHWDVWQCVIKPNLATL